MATPKLKRLAKKFMQQIQDPVIDDPENSDLILPGQIVRTIPEIEHYLGMAMMRFIEGVWQQANANAGVMLRALPDIYQERDLTILSGQQKVDIASTHADVWDILDSRNGTTTILEIWNAIHLTDALNGSDPFYVGDERRGGLIYQKPFVWVFPASLSEATDYTFTLCFLQAPLNPTDGTYLTIGGDYDIPFSDIHFPTICDIAEKIYKVDDYQEDAG